MGRLWGKRLRDNYISDFDAELSAFISSERSYFEVEGNNMFAMAFGQVRRYYGFLVLIKARHDRLSDNYRKLSERCMALIPTHSGPAPITKELGAVMEEMSGMSVQFQLEIESYYVFAKIMLDRVAHFIEFIYGPARRLPLDSHDQLTKHFKGYCAAKGLKDFVNVETLLSSLKQDISDYRDYQIAHEKSPRTIRAIAISDAGDASVMATKIYPKESDGQVQSQSPAKLELDLLRYLTEIMALVRANREQCKLKPVAAS